MMDNKGFDEWAEDYDVSIDQQKGYPFEGYRETLRFVRNTLGGVKGKKILDLGVGTGLLSYELYKRGAVIVGVDFSPEMIHRAEEKMPDSEFYVQDLKDGIPDELCDERLDNIISSYAIHHLEDDEKIDLICSLKELLTEEGTIIIGDVSFKDSKDREHCRKRNLEEWDDSEHYIVADEFCSALRDRSIQCRYTQVSSCAGVLVVYNDDRREIRIP